MIQVIRVYAQINRKKCLRIKSINNNSVLLNATYRHNIRVDLSTTCTCESTRRSFDYGEVVRAAPRRTVSVGKCVAADGHFAGGSGGVFDVQHGVPARPRHVVELKVVAVLGRTVGGIQSSRHSRDCG